MIKQGLIYCIILINSAPVLAQWELPPGALVRKQIHQLRDTDTDEWEDFGVTTKAYDARGREVYEESRIKSNNGSWYINQKGFYAYNNFGNLTRYHFKSYQANPHKLGYESLKEYEYLNDTLLTRIYKLNKDLINNEQWESWDFFIYDHKNRNIRNKSIYGSLEKPESGIEFRSYYNEIDCRVGHAWYRLIEGTVDSWVLMDSSSVEKNEYCHDLLKTSYRYEANEITVFYQQKYERAYDPDNRPTKIFHYSRDFPEMEWVFKSETSISYVGNKEVTRIVSENRENYEEVETDESGRQILYIYKWKEINSEYWNYENITEYTYEENGNLSDIISRTKIRDDSTGEFETRGEETLFTYRCDGALTGMIYKNFRQSKDYENENHHRTLYEYVTTADCEPPEYPSESIVLFPNPARQYIHVLFDAPAGNSTLSIISSKGDVVREYQGNLKSYNSLDLKTLKSGMYILRIEIENRMYSSRFVKVD